MDDVLDGFDGGGDSGDLGGFTSLAFLSALELDDAVGADTTAGTFEDDTLAGDADTGARGGKLSRSRARPRRTRLSSRRRIRRACIEVWARSNALTASACCSNAS